jgi:trehalose-6-phosphate synthase
LDRPEFVDIGARETGLAVKETRTSQMTTRFSDGTTAALAHPIGSEVTVLEKMALDPALFEVPAGYKQVEPTRRGTAE